MRQVFVRAVVFTVATPLAVMPPTIAYAHYTSQLNYAQQQYANIGRYSTLGQDHRHYNRVWHTPGYVWAVWYDDEPTGTSYIGGFASGSDNPTRWENEIGYAYSACYSAQEYVDPDQWTCQTTT